MTIATEDIPLWRWDDIDAGTWAVIQAVKAAYQAGVDDAREERRALQSSQSG